MSIESQPQTEADGRLPVGEAGIGLRHGSSRMLESYLRDIEYLVREKQSERALSLALALPHICAALSSPDLVSSREAYRDWCESWVRPARDDTSLSLPSSEALCRLAEERAVEPELGSRSGVPARALRALRLRRLSRDALPRARRTSAETTAANDAPQSEACAALLDAVRRWYGDWAAGAPIVQTNLARLAVLR